MAQDIFGVDNSVVLISMGGVGVVNRFMKRIRNSFLFPDENPQTQLTMGAQERAKNLQLCAGGWLSKLAPEHKINRANQADACP